MKRKKEKSLKIGQWRRAMSESGGKRKEQSEIRDESEKGQSTLRREGERERESESVSIDKLQGKRVNEKKRRRGRVY